MVRRLAGPGLQGTRWDRLLPPGLVIGILLIASSQLLSACSQPSPRTTPERLTPTPAASPAGSPPASATRLVPLPTAAGTSDQIALKVWAPEELSPTASRGGDVLRRQIAAFRVEHPDIDVSYELKGAHGKGGLVDFVLQVNDLVPERLPDVVIVESRELEPLARAGLVQPLNREFAAGIFLDLFTPAQGIASENGIFTNLPVAVDAEQLIYDSRRIKDPPATWDQLIALKTSFAFAADSTDVFLFHYLENGGVLPANADSALSRGALETVLGYYQRLRREQVLGDNALAFRTSGDVLPSFQSGETPLAEVQARDWLEKRAGLTDAALAPLPTHDGRATTWVTAWSYAVLVRAPERNRAALQFVEWMNEPARVAEWANVAQRIPARKSAFADALGTTPYADVLWLCLENGIAAPSLQAQQPYVDSLQAAVQAVLRGQLSPEMAAAQVNAGLPP